VYGVSSAAAQRAREHDDGKPARHLTSPFFIRPSGRQTATIAISSETPMPESSVKKTLPKVSRSDQQRPMSAPLIEPMPPMTTTTKEMMSTFPHGPR